MEKNSNILDKTPNCSDSSNGRPNESQGSQLKPRPMSGKKLAIGPNSSSSVEIMVKAPLSVQKDESEHISNDILSGNVYNENDSPYLK